MAKYVVSLSKELLIGFEHEGTFLRRKKRTLWQLGSEERIAIARLAATKELTQRDVAERHNVSVGIVTRLVRTLRHNISGFTA